MDIAGLPRPLADCGVKPQDIPLLAREAASQWTAQFNPRPVVASDFEMIYTEALALR